MMTGSSKSDAVDVAEGEGVALGPDAELEADAVDRDGALKLDGEPLGHRFQRALGGRVADAAENPGFTDAPEEMLTTRPSPASRMRGQK